MISFEEAQRILDKELLDRTIPPESFSVLDGLGLALAEPAVSRLDLPPFDKSAMDGYAVMEHDKRDAYRVLEQIPAGKIPTLPLEPGSASMIMTGAPVPKGAGRVIMFEDTNRGAEVVRVNRHDERPNICQQGEDVRAGQQILSAGTRLGAGEIANLVSCGISRVSATRRVRLAIITTGNEIVASFEDIEPGKIMDSNGPMLVALGVEQACEVVHRKRVSDDCRVLLSAMEEGSRLADIVLLSGGVSAGKFDFVPDAMKAAGFEIRFDRVAMQPGKPITFAVAKDAIAFGLPGNPVSAFVGFHFFVRRAAGFLSGMAPSLKSFKVSLGEEIRRRRVGRTAFQPCTLDRDGRVHPIAYHGSAHLLALCGADGFLKVPEGVAEIADGEKVDFYPVSMRG